MNVTIPRGEAPEGYLAADNADTWNAIHYAGNNANEAFVVVIPAIRALTRIRRKQELSSESMDVEPMWSFQVLMADIEPVKFIFYTQEEALAMRAAILIKIENYFGERRS